MVPHAEDPRELGGAFSITIFRAGVIRGFGLGRETTHLELPGLSPILQLATRPSDHSTLTVLSAGEASPRATQR
jgi:hypothetical protein